MFRLLLPLIGLLLPLVSVSAQGVGIGLRTGASFANANFDDDTREFDTQNLTGYSLGLMVPIFLSDNFAVQPELSYVQKGFKRELAFTAGVELQTFTISYYEIPVLLRASFGPDNLKFYFQGGAAFGYAGSGEVELEGIITDVDFSSDAFNRTDVSGIGGAGLQFGGAGLSLFVDGRYVYGLSESGTLDDEFSYTNRGLTLSAGLLFMLGNM